jgi:2'-5' RNA ligase
MTKFRGFIAVDIDVFSKIKMFSNEVKKSGVNLKLVEPENIHLTLKFLGDTDEALIDKIEEIMKKSVENINPFEIQLNSVGVFPNLNYIKVVWIGIQNGENLDIIAKDINEKLANLGFNRDKRGFSAHLTIARVKSAKNKDKLIQIINKYQDVEFSNQKIGSLKLKKSDLTLKGPIYTTLREVKL